MNRKLMLSKDALLWEAGDPARNIAIVEQGKLGVKTEKGIIGVVSPKMILGETAIFSLEGQVPKRTATVLALEDNTVVTEYSAVLVKQLFDTHDPTITPLIFNTLVGQMGKHCILVISTNKQYPVIQATASELLKGIVQSARELHTIKTWDAFMRTFRYLCSLRDFLSTLSESFLLNTSDMADMVTKATTVMKELLSDKDKDVVPYLEDFIQTEKQKEDWFER